MSISIPRTVIEVRADGSKTSQPLASYRDRSAYVLLGDSGAGKSTAFTEEAAAMGGHFTTARDFVDLNKIAVNPDVTLFIDGLDEIRAGTQDGRTPLGRIREKLDRLGSPRFRLSCREADWLGATDQEALKAVSPDEAIVVLHLEELSESEILQLLAQDLDVSDPKKFVGSARERRLDALLGNPQALGMLATAVRQGWPNNLTETYERACLELAKEVNRQHRNAQRESSVTVSSDALLDAAGNLCAVQLLAGIAGYALDPDAADDRYPTCQSIGISHSDAMGQAFKSKLFQAGGQEERRVPVHRSIAEFLGARFLTQQIDKNKLPLGRVTALMVADDGGIVADLRGFHAWLATLCGTARTVCISQDPLGLVLYGDIWQFNVGDRLRLLDALMQEARRNPWFRAGNWHDSPFGVFANPDSADYLLGILNANKRDIHHESFLSCALDAIAHGMPLPDLADALLAIVRDASHLPRNRRSALDAYIHVASGSVAPLLSVVNDINAGNVDDDEDELLGGLLQYLYPKHITSVQVIRYLHPAKTENLIGAYCMFLDHHLFATSTPEDFTCLLDAVVENQSTINTGFGLYQYNRFLGQLLARGLEAVGKAVPIDKLWGWLGIGLGEHDYCYLDSERQQQIAQHLVNHPNLFQALMAYAVQHCVDRSNPSRSFFSIGRHFYQAQAPFSMMGWCFEQASTGETEEIRGELFALGCQILLRQYGDDPVVIESLNSVRDQYPILSDRVAASLKSEWSDWRQDHAQCKTIREEEKEYRIEKFRAAIRDETNSLLNGTVEPVTIGRLADIYFGHNLNAQADTPIERLKAISGEDDEVVQTILIGLQKTLKRDDLPAIATIFDLRVNGQFHFLGKACLAGIDIWFNDHPDQVLELDREILNRVIAFHFAHGAGETPGWFRVLIEHRPDWVAEVLVSYGKAMFSAQKEYVSGPYVLAHEPAHAQVASFATKPLLDAFPLRSKKKQSDHLGHLLLAAIQYIGRDQILALVEAKISLKRLSLLQRIYWLCVGFLLDPNKFASCLEQCVGKVKARVWIVIGFFEHRFLDAPQIGKLPALSVALLLRLVAPHISADRPTGVCSVTPELQAADWVRLLMSQLGNDPTPDAAQALEALLGDPSLCHWHLTLQHYRQSQRVVSREAHFSRADAKAVVDVLDNGSPANVSDLMALAVAHLRDIAREDRDGNTLGYRRYWNVDRNGNASEPRVEEDCRNRLLELLRERLRGAGIDAQPEARQADATRADICLGYGGVDGMYLPIEIKRDRHPDLWTALHGQLIADYTRTPGADGHGIYLVFWFDGDGMPRPPEGDPPSSSQELEARLRGLLSPTEHLRVEIIVIDCSIPSRRRR